MASKADIWERLGEHVTYSYMPQACRVAMDDARREIARLRDDAIEASVEIERYRATLRQIADSGDGSINAHLARTVLGDYAKGQTDAQQGD